MADEKVTDLVELTTLSTADLLYAVDDPGVTPLSRKITMLNTAKAAMGFTGVGQEYIVQELLQ